ncbi:UDP-N-acetylmuramoyl-L-alanine--D-glutamate ligase [Thalassotalea sp. M1531]|uniref:UDP-N-acetylmuramoylalanine--D-glutamate ligase n=1 Tax=Thalassotalea algicola TaxID=2716224 RepID=A0A7Y0Q6I2_9GAMM|nr:UDP-N-acetylmuramoyl-L-alanine--D-glutamate ligase [Thalassotalea algicola]NMP32044.1 UDP-N-acetylmuramoyl-L-alanine--D-glutamate ligase [Thalassotalea algicola]
MLDLSQLQNKRIVVLGLGLTGMSFVRFLSNKKTYNALNFAVNDSRSSHAQFEEFKRDYATIELVTGCWDSRLIASAEILLVSPGVDINQPEIADNIADNCQVWGDIELYARLKQTPCVAITGSNGKSTVVNLIHHIGQKLGVKTQLGGNVGVPVLDTLDTEPELLILELSSFQLETLTSLTPIVSCMLNLSDDHLDRHKSIENYGEIKQRVYQGAQYAVFNRDDLVTKPTSELAAVSFGKDSPAANQFGIIETTRGKFLALGKQALMPLSQLTISGIHNATNVLAALAIGQLLKWPLDTMLEALASFEGLAHRCQAIASNDDIFWINDSKATNVGATVAAIEGISSTIGAQQQLILIAGGDGKGADFSPLKAVIDEHVSQLFALGKDKAQLLALSEKSQAVESLEQAVELSRTIAKSGDVVLLSPACASIDMFTNFAERGQTFVDAINNVKEAS